MPYSNITKKALAAAMKELMAERPFAKINVGDICERCGMNRKSFYYHFQDKYDLVNWIFYTEFVERVQSREYTTGWQFLEDICEYFYENRDFYVNALQVTGQNSFTEYFTEMMQPVILSYFHDSMNGEDESLRDFNAVFFADAVRVAILRWLTEHTQIPPKEFIDRVMKVTTGVALRLLKDVQAEKADKPADVLPPEPQA